MFRFVFFVFSLLIVSSPSKSLELKEIVVPFGPGGPTATFVSTDKIYTDEYNQNKFKKELITALKEEHDPTVQQEWAKQFDWVNIANDWRTSING